MSDAVWQALVNKAPDFVLAIASLVTAIGALVAIVLARRAGKVAAENTTQITSAKHDVAAVKRVAQQCEETAHQAAKEARQAKLDSDINATRQGEVRDFLDTNMSGPWQDHLAKTNQATLN